jgi:hypothetical protein
MANCILKNWRADFYYNPGINVNYWKGITLKYHRKKDLFFRR